MPERVQLSRAKGWRMPPNTVKVDRSTKSWGNPYRVVRVNELASGIAVNAWQVQCGGWESGLFPTAQEATDYAVRLYRQMHGPPNEHRRIPGWEKLVGKNLACWCPLPAKGEPDICHAAVMLELVAKWAAEEAS